MRAPRSGTMASILVLALAAGGRAGPSPSPSGTVTMEELVGQVLAGNPDLETAEAAVDQAKAGLAAARADSRALVGLGVTALAADAPSSYLFRRIDARVLPAGVNFNDPGRFADFGAALEIQQPLFDGGRRELRRKAAEAGALAAEDRLQAARNDLVHATLEAAFGLLSAREQRTVAETSLTAVRSELAAARTRLAAGAALRSDVLALEVRAARAEEASVQADHAISRARSGLNRLRGASPDAPLALDGPTWQPRRLPETEAEAREQAARTRPELKALNRQRTAADHLARAAAREGRPRIDASARWWLDDPQAQFAVDRDNWQVGLGASWNLADGGRRRAGRSRADAELRAAESALEAQLRQVELEVHQAYLGLSEATTRHRIAETAARLAEETLALVRTQFDGGAATVSAYLVAEDERTRARAAEVLARYDLARARARVGHALGLCGEAAEEIRRLRGDDHATTR